MFFICILLITTFPFKKFFEDTFNSIPILDGKESACDAEDPGLILCQEDPLEKGMATYSIILAWRNPWTEEPGWLQLMVSQKVQHD